MEEKISKIKGFLSRYVNSNNLDENTDIYKTKLVNSLFAMQLVLFIEKEFNMEITNEELDINNFNTLNNIIKFIQIKKYNN